MIMDNVKNGRWIIPFKKFDMVRVNNRKRGNTVKEFKPSCKWTDTFQEIVGTLCSRTIPYVPKPLQRRTFSRKRSQFVAKDFPHVVHTCAFDSACMLHLCL